MRESWWPIQVILVSRSGEWGEAVNAGHQQWAVVLVVEHVPQDIPLSEVSSSVCLLQSGGP